MTFHYLHYDISERMHACIHVFMCSAMQSPYCTSGLLGIALPVYMYASPSHRLLFRYVISFHAFMLEFYYTNILVYIDIFFDIKISIFIYGIFWHFIFGIYLFDILGINIYGMVHGILYI